MMGYELSEVLLLVNSKAATLVPDDPAFSFLGEPGELFYELPQNEKEGLLFLGIASDEIEAGVFADDQVQLNLKSVEGPGEVYLYSTDSFGKPNVFFNTADGISEADTFEIKAGAHAHQSMAFSEAGTYRVSFDFSGTLAADGQETRSGEFQLLFEVEEDGHGDNVAAVYNWIEGEWELIQVNEEVSDDWIALYDETLVEGEAGPDVDYASNGLRIEFPIDVSMATVLVPIIDDVETEPTEFFGMILSNPESGYIADQGSAIVGIIDDECSFELTVESAEITENGGPLSIEVRRTGGVVNPVTIEYDVENGTAENTIDYLKGAGRINFESGQEVAYIVVPIINDIEMEGLETFELMLINAVVDPAIALQGSAALGENTAVQVTIVDDEMPGGVDQGFKLVGGANGPVHSVIVDPDERILLGGDFTRVGGVLYGHVSRLHPDGYVDSSFNVGTGLDDIVWALGVQSDRKPVPGGRFTIIDGNDLEAFGRLNADGVFDDTFAIDSGVNGEVFAVAVQPDGAIIIGGDFTKVAGESVRNIARLNPDGMLDLTFVVDGGADRAVRDLAIQPDGKILVVGDFGVLGGAVLPRVGRLNTDGTVDVTFVPGSGANAIVHAVGIQEDGGMIVGGEFTMFGGKECTYIARMQSDGTLDEEWGGTVVAINGSVFDLGSLSDGKVIIGGEFTEISGQSRNSYARLHANGELDRNFDPGEGANGPVFSVAIQPDGNILLGGQFTEVGGYEQPNITRVYGGEQYALGRVEFKFTKIEYIEGVGTYDLTIMRSGRVQEPVTVQYKTVSGTAVEGEDFSAASGEIKFDIGGREANISISLLDDDLAEGTETFLIELSSEEVGVDLGGRSSLEVAVIDNESSASFDQTTLSLSENAGEVVLVVNRYGGIATESTVNYTISDGSAKVGEDYNAIVEGTLVFAEGSSTASLVVAIVDDLIEEPTEELTVTLFGPSEGLTLVGDLTATVTVLDNDKPKPGIVTFETGLIPADSGWSSAGDKPWYIQTDTVFEGSYSLRSGKITDSQESLLSLETKTGAGRAYFYVKVSTEQDWDALEFLLNGRVLAKWSGRADWVKFEFSVDAGDNVLEWRYRKDSSTFAGMDAVFIDNIFLPEPIKVDPPSETKPTLTVVGVTAEGLQLAISGDASTDYQLQYSVDLNTWNSLAEVTTDELGKAVFTDVDHRENLAKETWSEGAGFYRSVLSSPEEGE